MGILWIFLCFFCDFLASGDLVCLEGVGNKEIPLVILQFWWPQSKHMQENPLIFFVFGDLQF